MQHRPTSGLGAAGNTGGTDPASQYLQRSSWGGSVLSPRQHGLAVLGTPGEIMDEDYEDEGWFPEFPGDTRYAFCDQCVVHEGHVYRALNGNTYECPGFDAEDLAALQAEALRPPCEHGLSQSLCAGPGHYPAEY